MVLVFFVTLKLEGGAPGATGQKPEAKRSGLRNYDKYKT